MTWPRSSRARIQALEARIAALEAWNTTHAALHQADAETLSHVRRVVDQLADLIAAHRAQGQPPPSPRLEA